MVAELRVYYEGDAALKEGFHTFFREIREAAFARNCGFRLIYGKGTAVQDFCTAVPKHPAACCFLLLDSDGPDDKRLLDRLKQSRAWDRCRGRRDVDTNVFWMVQCMEAWFLADLDAVAQFYGPGFGRSVLAGILKSSKSERRML